MSSAPPDKPRRKRWRRFAVRSLLLAAILAIAAPAALLLGLQSSAIRRAILDRIASAVENGVDLRMTARDFRLGLTTGIVEIEDLTLAGGGRRRCGAVSGHSSCARRRAVDDAPGAIDR